MPIINKPNSNPISEKPKMNASVFTTKDYENKTALRPRKTNPIKANLERAELRRAESSGIATSRGPEWSYIYSGKWADSTTNQRQHDYLLQQAAYWISLYSSLILRRFTFLTRSERFSIHQIVVACKVSNWKNG